MDDILVGSLILGILMRDLSNNSFKIKEDSFKFKLMAGNSKDVLKQFPENTFHMAVTSPPYWAQRNYKVEGQLGQENTP